MPTRRRPAEVAVAGSERKALAGARAPAGAAVCPQGGHARGEDPGGAHPRPAQWVVPPDERPRKEPAGPEDGDRRPGAPVRTAPMAGRAIE